MERQSVSSPSDRVLVISAHPDDAEFTAGGSLARWAAEGWSVHLMVCTDGGKGSHDPAMKPPALAAIRQAEQMAASLSAAGFDDFAFVQTIFRELQHVREHEPVREGYGEGSFVVIRGVK